MIEHLTNELIDFYKNGRAVGGDSKTLDKIQEKGFALGYTWGLRGTQEPRYATTMYLNFRYKFFSLSKAPPYPSHSSPPEYILDMMEYFDKNIRTAYIWSQDVIVTKERIIPRTGYPIYAAETEKLISLYREVSDV